MHGIGIAAKVIMVREVVKHKNVPQELNQRTWQDKGERKHVVFELFVLLTWVWHKIDRQAWRGRGLLSCQVVRTHVVSGAPESSLPLSLVYLLTLCYCAICLHACMLLKLQRFISVVHWLARVAVNWWMPETVAWSGHPGQRIAVDTCCSTCCISTSRN